MRNIRNAIVDIFPFAILCVTTAVTPLLFVPLTRDAVNIPKELFLFLGIGLALFFWFLRIVFTKQIRVRKTILDIPLIVLGFLTIVSTILSKSVGLSLFGRADSFVLHVSTFCIFLVGAWMLIQETTSTKRWHTLQLCFLGAGAIVAVIFIFSGLSSVSGIAGQLGFSVVHGNIFSTSGAVFGVFMVTVATLSMGLLVRKQRHILSLVFYAVVTLLSLVSLVRLAFPSLLVLFAISCALLLVFGSIALSTSRAMILSFVLFLLFMTGLAWFFGIPAFLRQQVPTEVSVGVGSSIHIARDTMLEGVIPFLLGSGPGTFLFDFSAHRPVLFNANPHVASFRFSQPYASAYAFPAELGLLGSVLFLIIVLIGAGVVIPSILGMKERKGWRLPSSHIHTSGFDGAVTGIAWCMATAGLFVSFFDVGMWWVWWWLLSMTIVGCHVRLDGLIRKKEMQINPTPQVHLLLSFVGVTVFTLFVICGAFGARAYMAEVWITRAGATGSPEQLIVLTSRATTLRPSYAPYHVALSRAYLLRAQRASERTEADPDDVARDLAYATNEAKAATELDEKNVATWEALSTMYMNARTFAEDANEWGRDAIIRSIQLEPTNPTFHWRLGDTYAFDKAQKEAVQSYRQAIGLSPNFIAAYESLALLYETAGDTDMAVSVYDELFVHNPENIDALYQKGRLFFNRNKGNDILEAEEMWLAVLDAQPDHANALYSLGLLNERLGKYQIALSYYKKVRDLNPGNEDLDFKIRQLGGG